MPTEPFKKLLDRDLAKVAAKPLIDLASPLLIEVVNKATKVFRRCEVSIVRGDETETVEKEGEHVAPLLLYWQIIRMGDGIEVLISNSCSEPALPLLRTMWEVYLSLEYIFKEHYKRRSLSWLCSYFHDQIESHEILEKKSSNSDTGLSSSEVVRRLHALIADKLSTIEEEYKRQKKKRRHWYSLFGGPQHLRELACQLSKEREYDLLYRKLSSVAHATVMDATDASRFLMKASDGGPEFHRIRNPIHLKYYAVFAAEFLIPATFLMIEKFIPSEDLGRWYETEVKERLDHLKKIKIMPIKDWVDYSIPSHRNHFHTIRSIITCFIHLRIYRIHFHVV